MSTKTKSKTPAKIIGTRKFKLSELPVDALVSLAKDMNKKIRIDHKENSKKLLAQVKKDEKEKLAKVKAMLTKKLKDTLIKTAKRKKTDLLKDIMKNKQHIPKSAAPIKGAPKAAPKEKAKPKTPEPPPVDMTAETTDEEEEEEKPKFITRRIGGKIRRIPVNNLKKAAEKKKEEKKESKPAPKPEPKATKEDKQIARIGSTRLRTKLAARFDIKAEQAEKKKAEAKKPEPKKKKEAFTVTKADGSKVQLYFKEGKEPKATPAAAAAAPAKAAPAKDSELKKLKKELKSKGVPSAALKFIKTVAQAKSKLEEIEEAEPEDVKVEISPKVLQQIPMKNQAKIKKLIKKVLPRDEFTLQDQVEYFNDLKEMGENWDMSSIPRQRYDKFDPDEKLLFELLYPAIFDKKAKKARGEAKRAERKAKEQ